MRSHAKASSAGTTQRRVAGLGHFVRGAFAGRGVSSDADGSGAPSPGRVRLGLLALAAALFATLLLATTAFASKEVLNYFGTASGSGTLGGEFDNPRGVAVNTTGEGPAGEGDVYVADDSNNRIERFDSGGNFISAWGANATHRDEVQAVTVNATAGTFALTLEGETTAAIAYGASRTAVDNALDVLPFVGGDANVAVSSDGPAGERTYTVTFQSALEGADVGEMTADDTELTGTVEVATVEDGSGGAGTDYEICTVAADCGEAVGSGGNGTAAGNGSLNHPQSVAVDNDTGNVYVSDRNNRRIDEYEGDGTFVRAFGWNVIQTNEVQAVTVAATSGNFTLSFEGEATGELEATAAAGEVEAALNGLAAIEAGGGSVSVSGGPGDETGSEPYVVTFDGGPLAHTDVAQMTATDVSLAGGSPSSEVTVATTTPGGGVNEYGVCEASDVCKAGVGAGTPGTGQFGSSSTSGAWGIAVSPADGEAAVGKVFLANTSAERVNTYDLDGANPADFGSSATFGSNQPRMIAVDPGGIVYASNSNGNGEIERYDTGAAAFLDPILAPVNETQEINFSGFSSGIPFFGIPADTFTLTCPDGKTTGPIDYAGGGTRATNIKNALEAKCGAGNFAASSSGSHTTVTFQGAYAATDVDPMVCTTVTGSGTCSITAESDGFTGPLLTGSSATATSGLAVDSSGALYVLRNPSEGPTVVQQFDSPGDATPPAADDDEHGSGANLEGVNGLGLDDSSGRLYVSSTGNIASYGPGHRVYVLDDLSAVPVPVPTIDPVTVKGETTATFSGTVDPAGNLVSCRFQHSTNKVAWTDVAVKGCAALDLDGGAQAVSIDVTGLDPNTHYYVRLAASRPYVPGPESTVTSDTVEFDTDSVPPVVSSIGVLDIQDTSVRMTGTVDPRHSDTGYVFEYGTTPSLGSSTPPLAIGGGTTPLVLSQVVGGLSPDTTYYYRMVATNAFGSTASSQRTFHTRAVPLPLPDDRRYEMVSPPDKNGGDADLPGGGIGPETAISTDGESVGFCTVAIFGEPPSQVGTSPCVGYLSHRTAGGWQTKGMFPPYCTRNTAAGDFLVNQRQWLSADMNAAAMAIFEPEGCPVPPLDPAAPVVTDYRDTNLYAQDLSGDVSDPSSFQLVAPKIPRGFAFADGSDDLSRVYFVSDENQTEPPDSPAPGGFAKLYEWVEAGPGCSAADPSYQPSLGPHGACLAVASKGPSGAPFTTDSSIPVMQGESGTAEFPRNAVSADGNRIYFQNTADPGSEGSGGNYGGYCAPGCQLYMRENGQKAPSPQVHGSASGSGDLTEGSPTVANPVASAGAFEVGQTIAGEGIPRNPTTTIVACTPDCASPTSLTLSAPASAGGSGVALSAWSECTDPSLACTFRLGTGQFQWASEDGSVALFSSSSKLTDDAIAGAQLYRWDRDLPPGNRLTSLGYNAQPIGMSADGNTIYTWRVNTTIRRWQWNGGSPDSEVIGTLTVDPISNKAHQDEYRNARYADDHVTPDGKYLLLSVSTPLDPAVDKDEDRDVYRWDEEDGWLCVSCQLPGVPSLGDANIGVSGTLSSKRIAKVALKNLVLEPKISADGQRIFFDTPDALVPQDVNGEAGCTEDSYPNGYLYTVKGCADVYEWHDGRVQLISSGTSPDPSYLIGLDASGKNAFFFTREKLVGWDTDNNVDVYDARIGGGLPEPAPQPPSCEGEACRGATTAAPSVAGAGTAVFEGPGNPASGRKNVCPRGKLRRGKRCLSRQAIARRRCRKLRGAARRRCIRRQVRRMKRAQKRRQRRARARTANHNRRAGR